MCAGVDGWECHAWAAKFAGLAGYQETWAAQVCLPVGPGPSDIDSGGNKVRNPYIVRGVAWPALLKLGIIAYYPSQPSHAETRGNVVSLLLLLTQTQQQRLTSTCCPKLSIKSLLIKHT